MNTTPRPVRRRAGFPAGQPMSAGFCSRLIGTSSFVWRTAFAAATAAILPHAAAAPVQSATSSAYGLSAKLTVAGLTVVDTLKFNEQSGTAPPAYTPAPLGGSLNVNTALLVATGVMTSNVSSTVDGQPGSRSTTASAQVANLNLSLADTALTDPLVAIGGPASVIGSQCQVQGNGVVSQTTASGTLTDVQLKVLGATVNIPANAAPNTVINAAGGVAGLTIYVNEQTPVGGANSSTIACTALRIKIDSVSILGIGLLSGEIKIASSAANQFSDADGDGLSNESDGDSDGDGIPNTTEAAQASANGDTDGDGIPNFLDLDSDNDGINDVIEAGGTDANGDGRQDGSADADNDGIIDTVDTTRGGTALPLPDSDSDGARDYLDLDSDNDAVSDLMEGGNGAADDDADGTADGSDSDQDGIRLTVDGSTSFGDAPSGAPTDTDNDGTPNYRDPSSNGPGSRDIALAGRGDQDLNGDGRVDNAADSDKDGIADAVDQKPGVFGGLGDADGDGVPDDEEGNGQVDTDGDGQPDSLDQDSDADGIPDSVERIYAGAGGDTDGDGIADRLDLDSDNDGLNDVIEAGGTDANGDARQDGTADADHDGLVDTVDPDQGGTPLPVPDSDGDGARDYVDLDSDNDTVSDLLEGGSGGPDTNRDGIVDGADTDGDGIRNPVDQLAGFGDANDPGARNTDGTDVPDYIDPDSDNAGGPDIENAGHKDLDDNGDGRIDSPVSDPDHDGVDATVDTMPEVFGGTGGCVSTGTEWRSENFTAAELGNPAISGWDADPDKDGVSNSLEYVLGSDPRTPSALPDLAANFNATTGLTITLARDSCVRAFVAVEYSTDLVEWLSSGPGIHYVSDSPGQLIVNVTGESPGSGSGVAPRLFIRLKVTIP